MTSRGYFLLVPASRKPLGSYSPRTSTGYFLHVRPWAVVQIWRRRARPGGQQLANQAARHLGGKTGHKVHNRYDVTLMHAVVKWLLLAFQHRFTPHDVRLQSRFANEAD